MPRTCAACNTGMDQGFVIDDGAAYYCSEECLHKVMTEEEYMELYDDGEGTSYWTEWEPEPTIQPNKRELQSV